MVVYTFNPGTRAQKQNLWIWGHASLFREFQSSQGYMAKLCLKQQQKALKSNEEKSEIHNTVNIKYYRYKTIIMRSFIPFLCENSIIWTQFFPV